MAEIIRCDGGCGAESPHPITGRHEANDWMNLIVSRKNDGTWQRHRICQLCAVRNVFLCGNGEVVCASGFASDVLR